MDDHESMEISDCSINSSMSVNENLSPYLSTTNTDVNPVYSETLPRRSTSTPQKVNISSHGIRHLASQYIKQEENPRKKDCFPDLNMHSPHSTKSYRRRSAPPLSTFHHKMDETGGRKKDNMPDTITESPSKSPKNSRFNQSRNKAEAGKLSSSVKNKIYLMFAVLGIFIIIQLVVMSRHPNLSCQMTVSVSHLEEVLEMNVFGQHIATKVISDIAEEINMKMSNSSNRTHTVLSFHGWTGVGKNHIANLMSKILVPSKVKLFITPIHFTHPSLDPYYELNIPNWVTTNITKCIMNIFVFDEMDKASPGVIRGIRHALLWVNSSSEAKTWTMFVFLSNSQASDINNYVFAQLQAGRERESLQLSEFIPILLSEKGDTSWYGQLFKENLINHLVPFLPLSETHVKKCIKRDLRIKGRVPYEDLVSKVLDELPFYQPFQKSEKYSTTGCKRVSDKVDFHLYSED